MPISNLIVALMNQAEPVPGGLTTAGWTFVTLAWTSILSVLVFCYRKVLRHAEERKRQPQG